MGVVSKKVGVAYDFSRALRTHHYTRTPLLGNPGSAPAIMLKAGPIIVFSYAHGSVYYSSMSAYYSNLLFQCAREESMIKTIMNILNHILCSLSKTVLTCLKKNVTKQTKNLSDAADDG